MLGADSLRVAAPSPSVVVLLTAGGPGLCAAQRPAPAGSSPGLPRRCPSAPGPERRWGSCPGAC